jgi:hypothetical protein
MSQNNVQHVERDRKKDIRDIPLVNLSVFIAYCLEGTLLETDILYNFKGDILRILLLKVFFLTLIFVPLGLFVNRNGLTALKYVLGRVTIIAIIVLITLIIECV